VNLTKQQLKQLIKEEIQTVLLTELFEKAKFYRLKDGRIVACQNQGAGPCYVELKEGGWEKVTEKPHPGWKPCAKAWCEK